MVFRIIPDAVYREIKWRAATGRRTISDLITELLQSGLRAQPATPKPRAPLPAFDMGAAQVDLADRDALERALRPGP